MAPATIMTTSDAAAATFEPDAATDTPYTAPHALPHTDIGQLPGQQTDTTEETALTACLDPFVPDNTYITETFNSTDLVVVNYQCDENHELLHGNLTRSCNVTGIWSHPPPLCHSYGGDVMAAEIVGSFIAVVAVILLIIFMFDFNRYRRKKERVRHIIQRRLLLQSKGRPTAFHVKGVDLPAVQNSPKPIFSELLNGYKHSGPSNIPGGETRHPRRGINPPPSADNEFNMYKLPPLNANNTHLTREPTGLHESLQALSTQPLQREDPPQRPKKKQNFLRRKLDSKKSNKPSSKRISPQVSSEERSSDTIAHSKPILSRSRSVDIHDREFYDNQGFNLAHESPPRTRLHTTDLPPSDRIHNVRFNKYHPSDSINNGGTHINNVSDVIPPLNDEPDHGNPSLSDVYY